MIAASDTNTYTYFFRESRHVEMIRDHIIAPRTRRGLVTSIWSVGCSSGEEPGTLAIAARDVSGLTEILATDINERILEVARAGKYNERACRQVDPRHRKWFSKRGAEVVLDESIQREITYCRHDVITERPPLPRLQTGGWQVIMCRNVLIYYGQRDTQKALANMVAALAEDGILVLGGSEWPAAQGRGLLPWTPRLVCVDIGGVIGYQPAKGPDDASLDPQAAAPAVCAGPRRPASRDILTGGDTNAQQNAAGPTPSAWRSHPASPDRVVDEAGAQAPKDARDSINPSGDPRAKEVVQHRERGDRVLAKDARDSTEPSGDPCAQEVAQHREQGDRLLDAGDMPGALDAYRLALAADPLVADLYLRTAVCLLGVGRERDAEDSLKRCLFLAPDLWPAALMLGDLMRTYDTKAARRYFLQAKNALRRGAGAIAAQGPGMGALEPFLVSPQVALAAVHLRLDSLT